MSTSAPVLQNKLSARAVCGGRKKPYDAQGWCHIEKARGIIRKHLAVFSSEKGLPTNLIQGKIFEASFLVIRFQFFDMNYC